MCGIYFDHPRLVAFLKPNQRNYAAYYSFVQNRKLVIESFADY
jgi:hypothetical protein